MRNHEKDKLVSKLAFKDAVHCYSDEITVAERELLLSHCETNAKYEHNFKAAHQLIADLDEWAEHFSSDPELMAYAEEPLFDSKQYSFSWLGKTAVIVATLLLTVTSLFVVQQNMMSNKSDSNIHRYISRVGEQKRIELPDKSIITLNTNSQVLVDMNKDTRRIVMDRGEAYFDVAKDPLRPFTVELEGRSVTVLGTEFNLRRSQEGFSLAVVEGIVSIHRKGEKLAFNATALEPTAQQELRVKANKQQLIKAGVTVDFDAFNQQITARHDSNIKRQQQWRKGLLSFNGSPLSQVVAELNRYSTKYIQVESEKLGNLEVFATFKVNRIDLALKGLESSMSIKVETYFDRILLSDLVEQ